MSEEKTAQELRSAAERNCRDRQEHEARQETLRRSAMEARAEQNRLRAVLTATEAELAEESATVQDLNQELRTRETWAVACVMVLLSWFIPCVCYAVSGAISWFDVVLCLVPLVGFIRVGDLDGMRRRRKTKKTNSGKTGHFERTED